jgi:ABC-2 type transport system permease protein
MAVEIVRVAAVREAGGTLREDLRGLQVVWKREMIRFLRDRIRIVTSLAQALVFLFILGTGLSPIVQGGPGQSFDFRTFMFPGVIAMTVLFTSIFSGVSIVWDREFGFLREMLVAPVRRGAIVTGKCLGGATVATAQAAIMLALAPLVGVPYAPLMLVAMIAEMALAGFTLTALGVLIASRIQHIQAYQAVVQFFLLPMFFLSGAVFPLNRLPAWLAVLTKIDPLSYVVDPMRRTIFAYVSAPPALQQALNPGLSWGSWRLPVFFELGLVALAGLVLLAVAVVQFSRPE